MPSLLSKWMGTLLLTAMPAIAALAQQVRTAAIGAAGSSSTALKDLVVESTIGEVVIATIGSNPSCTQGMHQPNTLKVDFAADNKFVTVYPNPVSTTLFVKLYFEETAGVSFIIHSATGQQVLKREKSYLPGQHIEAFPVSLFKQGLYIITVKDQTNGNNLLVKFMKL